MYIFWLALLVWYFVDPAIRQYKIDAIYSVFTTVLFSFIIFAWFRADADEINLTPSVMLRLCVIAISILAVPYYLLRYKGFKRSLFSFLKFLGFIFLYLIITSFLAYYGIPK